MKAARLLTVLALAGLAGCTATDGAVPESRAGQATRTTAATQPDSEAVSDTATGEPFSLHTHCGFSTAVFAGRDWVAVTPPPVPAVRSDVTGIVMDDGYTEGAMTLVEDDLLRFVVTDPLVADVGLTVDFVPATAPRTSWCE